MFIVKKNITRNKLDMSPATNKLIFFDSVIFTRIKYMNISGAVIGRTVKSAIEVKTIIYLTSRSLYTISIFIDNSIRYKDATQKSKK